MAPLSSEHFLSEKQGPPLSFTHCNRLILPLGQLLTTFLCNFSTTCQLSISQLHLCVLDPTSHPVCFFSQRIPVLLPKSTLQMSLNLGFRGQEEKVPTQGNDGHCQRSGSRRRHYFSYFLAFIEMVTCNKIHLYEEYLIYFDNYTQL